MERFRSDIGRPDWPCIICGGKGKFNLYLHSPKSDSPDFNFAPDDAAYSLIFGDPLLPAQEESLSASRVVHISIDAGVPITRIMEDVDDGTTTDPDKVITNARPALPVDGLLSTRELITLFSRQSPVRSVYDEGQRKYRVANKDLPTFGDRTPLQSHRHGSYEPAWTSFTHYWKTVLG